MQSPTPTDPACNLLARLAAPAVYRGARPRLLALFAHPDDEVLAVGGRMEHFGTSLFLVATDGAPADGADARNHGFRSLADYRAARQRELGAALAHAGLHATVSRPLLLGSGIHVVDKEAMYHLVDLTQAMLRELRSFAPDGVLTHPFEGGHPDHDSCAFVTHAAMALLGTAAPPILEAPSYHAGPAGPDGRVGHIRTNTFLAADTPTQTAALTPDEQAAKRARLACFPSQVRTLAQFRTDMELFRLAPTYDFTKPPHLGAVFYESFGWHIDGADFCRHAAAALRELGLAPRSGRQGSGLP